MKTNQILIIVFCVELELPPTPFINQMLTLNLISMRSVTSDDKTREPVALSYIYDNWVKFPMTSDYDDDITIFIQDM